MCCVAWNFSSKSIIKCHEETQMHNLTRLTKHFPAAVISIYILLIWRHLGRYFSLMMSSFNILSTIWTIILTEQRLKRENWKYNYSSTSNWFKKCVHQIKHSVPRYNWSLFKLFPCWIRDTYIHTKGLVASC